MADRTIYLDYAATTPVHPDVIAAMAPYWRDHFGNPASSHRFGRTAGSAVDAARDRLAQFLHCSAPEIIFTSGATEADNLAIRGLVRAFSQTTRPHIVTTAIEHPAVMATGRELARTGAATVTYVPVNTDGIVSAADVVAAITPATVLVSVMLANNEIGTLQPVAAIGRQIAVLNKSRASRVYFHTDAVQAAAWQPMVVDTLGVDLLSLSAHKIYGPKGIGALYVRQGTPLEALQSGGDQEYGLRSGTVPVSLVVGFGAAVGRLQSSAWLETISRIQQLRDQLLAALLAPGDIRLNGSRTARLPNNINLTIPHAPAEQLTALLDLAGIALSAGSACAAGRVTPSHVLAALGRSAEEINCSLRITLGEDTAIADLPVVVAAVTQARQQIAKAQPPVLQ